MTGVIKCSKCTYLCAPVDSSFERKKILLNSICPIVDTASPIKRILNPFEINVKIFSKLIVTYGKLESCLCDSYNLKIWINSSSEYLKPFLWCAIQQSSNQAINQCRHSFSIILDNSSCRWRECSDPIQIRENIFKVISEIWKN